MMNDTATRLTRGSLKLTTALRIGQSPTGGRNVLADLPLSGVRYCTPSHEGVTDRSGSFSYRAGELVTFSLGGFVLGTTQGRSEVSPVELIDDARVLRALLLSQRQIANR